MGQEVSFGVEGAYSVSDVVLYIVLYVVCMLCASVVHVLHSFFCLHMHVGCDHSFFGISMDLFH